MLSAHLEDQFRDLLGEQDESARGESIRFAVDFVRMMAHITPEEVDENGVEAMADALRARTELESHEVDALLELALAPEHRVDVGDDEIRAFASRFGRAEGEALRAAVDEELDLGAFAERYGTAESLLLLDALFAVCGRDGRIDSTEIGRLQRAASSLGVDPMLVGALFRKHDPRHAAGDFTVELAGKDEVLIGRSTVTDVTLPDPQVSLRQARLVRGSEGWRIVDLGSGRPTLIDGSPVSSAPFGDEVNVRIGPYRLTLDPDADRLTVFGTTSSPRSPSGDSIAPSRTANRTSSSSTGSSSPSSAARSSRSSGPSGAGKTTLLSAIAGIAPPDSGDVLLDRDDFHQLLESDRSMVGIVPQEDVVHGELSVEESLRFAGRLRFPFDVKGESVQQEVDRVLTELGIDHIRNSRIGSALRRGISGGQRQARQPGPRAADAHDPRPLPGRAHVGPGSPDRAGHRRSGSPARRRWPHRLHRHPRCLARHPLAGRSPHGPGTGPGAWRGSAPRPRPSRTSGSTAPTRSSACCPTARLSSGRSATEPAPRGAPTCGRASTSRPRRRAADRWQATPTKALCTTPILDVDP